MNAQSFWAVQLKCCNRRRPKNYTMDNEHRLFMLCTFCYLLSHFCRNYVLRDVVARAHRPHRIESSECEAKTYDLIKIVLGAERGGDSIQNFECVLLWLDAAIFIISIIESRVKTLMISECVFIDKRFVISTDNEHQLQLIKVTTWAQSEMTIRPKLVRSNE